MLARDAYKPCREEGAVEPYRERIEDFLRRWRSQYEGNRVFRVLVITVAIAAYAVTSASLLQTPTYEASAHMLVGQKDQQMELLANQAGNGKIQPIPNAPTPETLQTIILTMIQTIDSRPVAEEAIQRLGLHMKPSELLDNLTVEQIEGTQFILLTYEDTDPERAQLIVNTVSEVSSERISPISAVGSEFTAMVWEKAAVPAAPVSSRPLRNGLLTLVIGLMLCAGTVAALPGVGARVAGTLGERPSRQGIGQARVLRRQRRDRSIVERVKEKELLRALGRRGKLTAVEAALESELSVEEAERMLQDLVAKGHLEVTVEHGKLLYSFWGDRGEDGA
jgi:capsular polysaccharide biosynthesis protein